MSTPTELLRDEHRAIEVWLDRLAAALLGEAGLPDLPHIFLQARFLQLEHYEKEERVFFPAVGEALPELVGKMQEQHEQADAVARHVEQLLPSGEGAQISDLSRLTRQFQAITQHNIIEEERVLFPLAERWLSPEQEQELAALLRPRT